jgi:hypothetical protein
LPQNPKIPFHHSQSNEFILTIHMTSIFMLTCKRVSIAFKLRIETWIGWNPKNILRSLLLFRNLADVYADNLYNNQINLDNVITYSISIYSLLLWYFMFSSFFNCLTILHQWTKIEKVDFIDMNYHFWKLIIKV